MKVTAISDLHGDRPKLKGGDLLIIAGDLTARDTFEQHCEFKKWLHELDYEKKIVIAGNHDMYLKGLPANELIFSSYNSKTGDQKSYASYLLDSGTEYQGFKIWGTPWTQWFHGVNPDCTAFMLRSEFELIEKYSLIPYDTDILISHGPCYMRLDKTLYGDYAGSQALRDQVEYLKGKQLKYHFHGHIHEAAGQHEEGGLKTYNVARMDRNYIPRNKILNIEI